MAGIQAREGKLYLCTFKDLWSNRIVGYSMSDRMTAALAVAAIRNAGLRRDCAGVTVHTDRGSQFRSRAFVSTLNELNMIGSMGRVGACLLTGQRDQRNRSSRCSRRTFSTDNPGRAVMSFARRSSSGSSGPTIGDANSAGSANSPQSNSKRCTTQHEISKPEHQPNSGQNRVPARRSCLCSSVRCNGAMLVPTRKGLQGDQRLSIVLVSGGRQLGLHGQRPSDRALFSGPVSLANLTLEDLPSDVVWKIINDVDTARNLVG